MLDIKLIRENPDIVRSDLDKRGEKEKIALLEEAILNDRQWRQTLEKANELKHDRNQLSKQISELKRSGGDATDLIARSAEIPKEINGLDKAADKLKAKVDSILMRLPNILHESVPVGQDSEANIEVRRWGEPEEPEFEILSHGELAEKLNVADFDRAARIAGAGFNYLKGDLARLDLALIGYAIDHMAAKGYTLVEPPFMMRREPYEGVTDLGDFENVMYKIEDEDLYLIATSEHPMAAMFLDEIIDEDELPLKFVGISPCFRKEIGAHGVDTKGLYRMHQFNKVEQFIFCEPEYSWNYHEELQRNTEEMYQGLGLPYRVVNVCTGDIGSIAAKKYDIEIWFPRQGKYGEVTSCSNCTDYQARRLNIRCGKQGGDKRIPHTLNNTAIATSRTMVAILENFQNEDGTVSVPGVLRKYMGGKETLGL